MIPELLFYCLEVIKIIYMQLYAAITVERIFISNLVNMQII